MLVADVVGEGLHGVGRAPVLEHAHPLQVLPLEEDLSPGRLVELAGREHRGPMDERCDPFAAAITSSGVGSRSSSVISPAWSTAPHGVEHDLAVVVPGA